MNFFGGLFFGSGFFGSVTTVGDGRGNWRLGKRKRLKPLKFKDLEEALEAKRVIEPPTVFIEPESPLENEDDDILIVALSRLIH